MSQERFFIGWAARPGRMLIVACVVLVAACWTIGAFVAARLDDPSASLFAFGGRDVVTAPESLDDMRVQGVLETRPYPILHVAADAQHPRGQAILLAGDGKRGASVDADTDAGRFVEVAGGALHRGSVLMIVSGDPPRKLDGAAPDVPRPQPLGRWRIAGEICDGKCYTGAMRPGNGLAHRACANLCILGEVPPLFVAAEPVDGAEFFLLADPSGGPLSDAIRDFVAIPIVLEGDLERRGDMLVFRVDLAKARSP